MPRSLLKAMAAGEGQHPPHHRREHDMESLSTYYPYDENPTDPDELIWGKYTEEEWDAMTCEERAEAIYASGFGA